MNTSPRSLVIYSGGMDSATLLFSEIRRCGVDNVRAISFDYGQRHKKELIYAEILCRRMQIPHNVLNLSQLRELLPNNSLTGDVPVPHGHYAAPSMMQTVVPNRNAIMLSIAFSVAAANGFNVVATGVHAGDHFIYPDCRPAFIERFQMMELESLRDVASVTIYTPFIHKTKRQIAELGQELGVKWYETYSCYEGRDKHCGKCGTCVERKEALEGFDTTVYAEQ